MRRTHEQLGVPQRTEEFDRIRISDSQPEVSGLGRTARLRAETINLSDLSTRSVTACSAARIFGPIKDYECLAASTSDEVSRHRLREVQRRGHPCPRCAASRMGHIELASPVAHIWFLLVPAVAHRPEMVDMTLKDLERVLYFENYVVVEPGLTPLKRHQLLSEEEYVDAQDRYGRERTSEGRESAPRRLKDNPERDRSRVRARGCPRRACARRGRRPSARSWSSVSS